jgi:hypothetical protein
MDLKLCIKMSQIFGENRFWIGISCEELSYKN